METVEDVKVPIIKEPKKNWLEIYTKIEAYRKDHIAPVDEFGCIGLGRRDLGDKVFRFETLVTLMLSAQTPDIKLFPTVRAIQAETPEGITPKALMDLGEDRIKAFLAKIGMQNQKSKALLGTSAILIEKYDSDIPPTFDALMELPGVGPKIAALTMSFAWNIDEAIGVDTHVHRISNRLGWVKSKNPEATRQQLEEWLPKDYWGPINPLLVGFGQTLCNALRPGCNECPVATLCPKIGIKSLTRKM
ncbi:DNA glycosylase [Phlyctochytrium arcticum]|nr:DNA glycosylase [Phlyctochytrium arcticum]